MAVNDIRSEKINSNPDTKSDDSTKPLPSPKPPKLEEKPFKEFINENLIPELISLLSKRGQSIEHITLKNDQRPIVGGECWMLYGQFPNGRRFWLTFNSDDIKSTKNIILAEASVKPSILESFLIDERKITLQLITSRFLQRLNGQKWFGNN